VRHPFLVLVFINVNDAQEIHDQMHSDPGHSDMQELSKRLCTSIPIAFIVRFFGDLQPGWTSSFQRAVDVRYAGAKGPRVW